MDPLASLPSDLQVDFLDQLWVLSYRPAADWLRVLWSQPLQIERIFPDMCGQGAVEAVEDALIDGFLDVNDLVYVNLEILAAVSGRTWWLANNIALAARGVWDRVGGQLLLKGVDPGRMPLGAWLDAAFSQMLEMSDPKKINTLITQLSSPPAGWKVELEEEEESKAFMELMQSGIPGM